MKKIIVLILVGVCVGFSGCALSNRFRETQAPGTTSTPSNSTIDVNNPETWNTFEFKELGFSIKLPFQASSVTSSYKTCEGECLKLEGYKKPFQWVLASAPTIGNDIYSDLFQLFSRSKDFNYCCHPSPISSFYDFYSDGDIYRYTNNSNILIHPLFTGYPDGQLAVLFDINEDYYKAFHITDEEGKEQIDFGFTPTVVVKIPNNSYFKAVIMQFGQKSSYSISLDTIKKIVSTIHFINKTP